MVANVNRNQCYGCYACANACPEHCITLEEDHEGFRYPAVDMAACIDCSLCDEACPIGRPADKLRTDSLEKPEIYAGYVRDKTARKRSMSGGLAFAISQYVIEQCGVVYGVVGQWHKHVHHTRAETLEELYPMCTSKNVQSDVGMAYAAVKHDLNEGRLTLFTGTPCQIAGLYACLGSVPEALITCDLICHGVPSQKVLLAYINQLEKTRNKKVVRFARDKTNRYAPCEYIVQYADGSHEVLLPTNSDYRRGFLSNLFQRPSCYSCEYASIPRIGDLTLGDIFFDNVLQKRLDPENIGVSLFLVNTDKGRQLLDQLKSRLYEERLENDTVIDKCENLTIPPKANNKRALFFKLFQKKGFAAAARRCTNTPFHRKIQVYLAKLYRRIQGLEIK